MKTLRLTIESVLLLSLAVFFFVLPFTSFRPLPPYAQAGAVWVGLCFLQVRIHHANPDGVLAAKTITVLRYCANGMFAVFLALGLYHYLVSPL